MNIGKLILVVGIGLVYFTTWVLCKSAKDADDIYEELARKKFAAQGGEQNAV